MRVEPRELQARIVSPAKAPQVGALERYGDSWRLLRPRRPERIIIELAEQIGRGGS